jgi:hypothetical protein
MIASSSVMSAGFRLSASATQAASYAVSPLEVQEATDDSSGSPTSKERSERASTSASSASLLQRLSATFRTSRKNWDGPTTERRPA